MAEDLIDSRRLIGKDYESVMKLLGRPDYGQKSPDCMLVYTVDDGEGFNFVDYLDIRCDSQGKVTSAGIRSD